MIAFGVELAGPLTAPDDSDALLCWLALFVQVPGDLVDEVFAGEDVWPVITALVGTGRIVVGGGEVTHVAIAEGERRAQARAAQDRWGAAIVAELHRGAVRFWLDRDDPCSAVFHLVRLGDTRTAIDYLTTSWQSAPFDIGHAAFLDTIQTLASDRGHPDHVELLAIQRIVAELPWPMAGHQRLDLQLLNAAPRSLADLAPRTRIVVTSAVVLSLVATGQLRQAISLGESLAVDASTIGSGHDFDPLEYLPFFWNALAEAYVTSGSPKRAVFNAAKAEATANVDRHPYAQFRAITLQAIALAMNGEYARAASRAASAREISSSVGWELTPAHYPLLLTDMLIAASRLDYLALIDATATLSQAFPDNTLWATTGLLSQGMAHLVLNEVEAGITIIRRLLNGTDENGLMGLIRGFALGMHADLLLEAGSAGETLALLGDSPSAIGHALCFDMQRSSAFLLLGQPERVLEATDACIAMGEEHCLRTLPPVLFRRAIAYEQMRLPVAADQAFHQGFLLIRESGSLIPLLNLSQSLLDQLWGRLLAAHPEYGDEIRELRGRAALLPTGPQNQPANATSTFTTRELQLARLLRAGLDSAAIAESLFLSPNTVKVHLHNLYRKLEVHTRSEALAKLEALGFHAVPFDS